MKTPQIRVLQLLSEIGTSGGLTKQEIARQLGTTPTLVGKAIGYSNPEKRAAFALTYEGRAVGIPLLTRGYVVETRIDDIELGRETLICITQSGYNAYQLLPDDKKRLGKPRDRWYDKRIRLMHEQDTQEEYQSGSED